VRPKLYLVGLGINSHLQITTEAYQVLEAADVAFALIDDESLMEMLSKRVETHDLAALYPDSGLRRDVYARITEHVVAEAQKRCRTAFVVHGHPLFLVSASERLIDAATSVGIEVFVLAAVSSFDTVMADLREDLGYAVQIFDATTLIEHDLPVARSVPSLIFQVANTLSPHIQRADPPAEILGPLREHLCRFYPGDRLCKLVYSATVPWEPATIREMELSRIDLDSVELWRRPTLYVPA
jgi:uncharacterized protein YabN with tetrapyrrole methylase and pyrophosphatase domain